MADRSASPEKQEGAEDKVPNGASDRWAMIGLALAITASILVDVVWWPGWIAAISYALLASNLILASVLIERIAAGASPLWAALMALGMGGGFFIKKAAEHEWELHGVPIMLLFFSALYGAFFATWVHLIARSERHRMIQAKAPPEPSAKRHGPRD